MISVIQSLYALFKGSKKFFYNGKSGVAQFYRTDRQGHINQLSNTIYSTGWTLIEWL